MTQYSVLDSRYAYRLWDLKDIVGEENFVYFMAQWSLAYVEAWTQKPCKVELDKEALYRAVVEQEKITKHQMVALLDILRQSLTPEEQKYLHRGLTSEDIMHNARTFQISSIIDKADEKFRQLDAILCYLPNYMVLGHTHGQPATPIRLRAYLSAKMGHTCHMVPSYNKSRYRLGGSNGQLSVLEDLYKINVTDLATKWLKAASNRLHPSLGVNNIDVGYLLQIGPDNAEAFTSGVTTALRLRSLARAFWDHAQRGILVLKTEKKQAGSSAMPHKVNPIHFENAEGCFSNAANLLSLAHEANIDTRGLRDLSNSVVNRHTIEGWVYLYLGVDSLLSGLNTSSYSARNVLAELRAHPECLTELVRYAAILKGAKDPYWELKIRPPKDFDKTWKKLGFGDPKNIYK